jgi:hypothetical protein
MTATEEEESGAILAFHQLLRAFDRSKARMVSQE